MKRLLTIILLSPFLVCDPQALVTSYQITGLATITTVAAQADGSLNADLGSIPAGTYSIKVRACAEPWGCSDEALFDFKKPSLGKSTNIRLTK